MEGGFGFAAIILACTLLLLPSPSFALPLCTDSRAPLTLNSTLKFCSYNGRACCNSTQDSELEKQFRAMNISDPKCASLLKSVVCAKCDPFSANLYRIDSTPRPVPVLCNSTVRQNSSQSSQAKNDFCSKLWDTCQSAWVLDSPFNPELQGQVGTPVNSHLTKLSGIWQTKNDFCDAFAGASTDLLMCFNGEPVALQNDSATSSPSKDGVCFEKIGNGSYLNMVAHPDGSDRAFFANQQGKVWLATIPEQGSGGALGLDELDPFIDITDNVQFDAQFGVMGMAFHPNFAQNGRFFISFNCDQYKWAGCAGRCSCNSDVNCDPSKLVPDDGSLTCQYHSVIVEYTVNGTATQASRATNAKPSEVRRIFTMGLPSTAHHGGQILFGPKDGYMYFLMGDGSGGDPYNFAQNKRSLLGKIMRLDVDNIPSATEIDQMGLWGNYSIPKDNPFSEDGELQPEIWALGLRNPWRCSFDSERPSYFICGDTGQDAYEEVDLITKGGNYGWRIFEGPKPYTPPSSPGGNTSVTSINPIFPVMGYYHSDVDSNTGSASITGGYIYRSMTDPCMVGRYLFADLYASSMWTGMEEPENSGNFTSRKVRFTCARDSPIACSSVAGSDVPSLGYIFSFGEDNRKDIFLLASSGVYRVVAPSRCRYACSKETRTAGPGSSNDTPSQATNSSNKYSRPVFVLWKILLLLCPCGWFSVSFF